MVRTYESILEKHSSTLEELEDCINEFGQLFYEIEKFEDETIGIKRKFLWLQIIKIIN